MSTASKFVVSLALAAAACSAFAAQYRVTVDGRPVEVIEIPAPSMHDWQLPDEAVRPYFRRMRGWFDRLRDMDLANVRMETLSMGMSDDALVAAQEGATMVRLGRALFCERLYKQ